MLSVLCSILAKETLSCAHLNPKGRLPALGFAFDKLVLPFKEGAKIKKAT